MFYIDKQLLDKRREVFFLRFLPPLIVFVAFFGLTLLSWNAARNILRANQLTILDQKNVTTTRAIKQRAENYEDILIGCVGLFDTNHEITEENWHTYLSIHNIAARYPGIQRIGFSKIVPADSLAAHIQEVRENGHPDYTITPAGDRQVYTSVLFSEPVNALTPMPRGYDMYSDPIRHKAMDRARTNGTLSLTNNVDIIADENKHPDQSSFILYAPVYRAPKDSFKTATERNGSAIGYVFISFFGADLLKRAESEESSNYGVMLTNMTGGTREKVFESPAFVGIQRKPGSFAQTEQFAVADATWQLTGTISPNIIDADARNRPTYALWGGLLFCIILSGFIYMLLLNRMYAITNKEESSIRLAKDELLALASHQLRTPATGVKQYIGMLREGFAGVLTKQQKVLIDKAYASNERQLGTIGEMLFVARADAKGLSDELQPINLTLLLQSILDENSAIFINNDQTLKYTQPARALHVMGNEQYLRMAIENIINNASKYTHRKGIIQVRLELVDTHSIEFSVKDSGVGVAREDYKLLFTKFSRIPNELTSKVNGSGIGLYLAKKVVQHHKGNITFTSKEKHGSTVTIVLPRFIKKDDD